MKKNEFSKKMVWRTLKIFWDASRKYKFLLTITIASSSLSIAAALGSPWFFKRFIDALATGQNVGHEGSTLLLGFFACNLLSVIAIRSYGLAASTMQPYVMSDLSEKSFSYTLGHSFQFFSDTFTGSLVKKINRFVRSFERIADQFGWNFIPIVVIITGTIVSLYIKWPLLALIFTLWVLAFFIFNIIGSKLKLPIDLKRSEVDSEAGGAMADAFTNHNTITLYAGKAYEERRYNEITERWRTWYIKGWRFGEYLFVVQSFMMFLIEVTMIGYGYYLWGQGILTVGDLVFIQSYLAIVFGRLWDLGRVMRNFYECIADAGEMIEILDLPHDITDKPNSKKLKISNGSIILKDVGFNYQETREVFKSLNLKIEPNTKIALIGTSGAGKSTLVKLLLRLYELTSGKIEIDGQDISFVTQESLRKNIAVVPQESILFHRSLMDNIRYGRRDATEKEVIEAAKRAQIHDFIKSLPKGYDTFVGERGVKLSGGERQRVAIARALLKNAPILILDEATSSLDSESEHLIQKALAELMKGKTTIAIAHRLSTIMAMDRIIVFENGKVRDSGTHQQLLEREGVYKKLWSIQAGGFLNEDVS